MRDPQPEYPEDEEEYEDEEELNDVNFR